MNDNVLKALLYPFEAGEREWPEGSRALFINALPLPSPWRDRAVDYHQWFKPKAERIGAEAIPCLPEDGGYDLVLLIGTKQHAETRYLMARGYALLAKNGLMVCAASNNAGGRRLKKDMSALGFEVHSCSKYKAQIVIAQKSNPGRCEDTARQWIQDGALQPVMGGAYQSRPGLFGWNKIDEGSALLIGHLPEDISGNGADFGCGYGYLSRLCLENYDTIRRLYCIDADARALEASRVNLKPYENKTDYVWSNLEKAKQPVSMLDFIVMNPPFHEDKRMMIDTGQRFIKTASETLRSGGALYMVANKHLPYEAILRECFSSAGIIKQDKGFKVIHAVR